jgi:hypothetical protein
MHSFRVWFTDGSGVLIDAISEAHCRRIVQQGIKTGQYYGKIAKVEKLN